jgi:hypothetical protein
MITSKTLEKLLGIAIGPQFPTEEVIPSMETVTIAACFHKLRKLF